MFVIDTMSRTPVYEQIVQQTEELLLAGALRPGEAMPSVRGLSVELGVNPNTIQKAYAELERRGMTLSVPGRGSFLREDAPDTLRQRVRDTKVPQLQSVIQELLAAGATREEILTLTTQALDSVKEGDL